MWLSICQMICKLCTLFTSTPCIVEKATKELEKHREQGKLVVVPVFDDESREEHSVAHTTTCSNCSVLPMTTTLPLAAVCSRKSAKAAALDSQLLLLYISHDTCAAMLCSILASLCLLEEKFHSYTLYTLY